MVTHMRLSASNKALTCNGITRPSLLQLVQGGGSGASIHMGTHAGSHRTPALWGGRAHVFFPSAPFHIDEAIVAENMWVCQGKDRDLCAPAQGQVMRGAELDGGAAPSYRPIPHPFSSPARYVSCAEQENLISHGGKACGSRGGCDIILIIMRIRNIREKRS